MSPIATNSIAANEGVPNASSGAREKQAWKPKSENFEEEASILDSKADVIRSGPKLDDEDRYVYERRTLEEMNAEERHTERIRRAETALAMGCALTPEEHALLGLSPPRR